MRPANCLVLFASLALVPAPASAQTFDVRRAVERESAHLALAASTLVDAPLQTPGAKPAPSDWSRVAKLGGGGEILLTTSDRPKTKQRLLGADDAGLALLRLADVDAPKDVTRYLDRLAAAHPEYFLNARSGNFYKLEKNLRLGPDGVSQSDRKLFGLAQVIEEVPRDQVREITVNRKHVGSHAKRGMIIGAVGGAVVMGAGAAACRPGSEPAYCSVAGMGLLGALGGAIVGLEYGFFVGLIVPRSEDVIYSRTDAAVTAADR